ncbi:MAG: GTPase HflX [Bacteroidetes bacterium]|nr:GTPase HflX [Bacteroidota bacterium]
MGRKLHITGEPNKETVLLVGAVYAKGSGDDSLDELAQLAETAGASVAGRVKQVLQRPNPATYIGSGKVEEIAEIVQNEKINTVLFDDELSPNQVRNLERIIGCKLIDRPQLILDIFAKRAKTATAKTQVELAQLDYLRTRLTRQWTHLSRQQGGIGTRGPGETQIETDRRLIGQRMATLRERLKRIDQQRRTQRRRRAKYCRIALVGYTNAGKSTLMNALSQSGVFAEDRLFATLDATTRQWPLSSSTTVLLSDTVGFIRKLPHKLIESFKSTLDEVRQSDVLLHVVSTAHPGFENQMTVVRQTLKEIGALEIPTLVVFNKIDALEAPSEILPALKRDYPEAIPIAALRGIGLNTLTSRVEDMVRGTQVEDSALIPVTDGRTLAEVQRLGEVLGQELVRVSSNGELAEEEALHVRFRITNDKSDELARLLAPHKGLKRLSGEA